jgi:hypothetical protein
MEAGGQFIPDLFPDLSDSPWCIAVLGAAQSTVEA